MFAEHAFDVKHFAVTPWRDDGAMHTTHPRAHALIPMPAPLEAAVVPSRPVRQPEAVYRRRRIVVAAVASALLAVLLVAARPDRVPPGASNPWPSVGGASLPAELPGVYEVQPGDTLWDIARALAPDADPRAWVHELTDALGGAALEPGQQIVIDAAAAPVAADGGSGSASTHGRPAPAESTAAGDFEAAGQSADAERADSDR